LELPILRQWRVRPRAVVVPVVLVPVVLVPVVRLVV
jgi:hypothetical protein